MRLWPQKRWKKILLVLLIVFLAFVVAGAATLQYVRVSINKDVVTPLEIVNTEGKQRALVVYQQGLSSGPKDAAYTFADGLVASGWRVEITTASPEAPSNLSDYKLLVLAYPIYGARPGEVATRYVDRLGNLQQINVVTIDVRWSNAVETVMKQQVEAQNGTVIHTLLAGIADLKQTASQITP